MERTTILNLLVSEFSKIPEILSIFEGGSTATGFQDQYSDIDLNFIIKDGAQIQVLAQVSRICGLVAPIEHEWIPQIQMWDKFHQKFLILKGFPHHFFLDVGMFEESAPHHYLEIERHGKAIVLHDPKNLVKLENVAPDHHAEKIRIRLNTIRGSYPILSRVVYKECLRGHYLDAFGFYTSRILGMYIELLGLKYRRERFDFGWRYLSRDLPKNEYDQISEWTKVVSCDDILKNLSVIDSKVEAILNESEPK